MKNLKDFEKELNKCSRCGLCTSACPIFKITHNDCTVSRGKFMMLLGVANGDLKLSDRINKYLDMCLKCGKCSEYCPAGIDVCTILNTAKYEYTKSKLPFKILYYIQSKILFGIIPKFFKELFKLKRAINNENSALKVLYFRGCVNKISPDTDKYISKIFKNVPVEIIAPDFVCCGLPFLSEGNMEGFIANAQHNTKLLNGGYDYLVTDCASCESTILDYNKYLPNFNFDEDKSINWGDLIAENNIKFVFNKPVTVTFHKPCHLKNADFVEKIMQNCENVNYVPMNNFDDCCGFAGTFALKNISLSKQLLKRKSSNIKNTGADYVITTCPSCLAGLKIGLLGSKVKAISLLEFLASADKIIS